MSKNQLEDFARTVQRDQALMKQVLDADVRTIARMAHDRGFDVTEADLNAAIAESGKLTSAQDFDTVAARDTCLPWHTCTHTI